jgi:tetratricopeptide (TPR) repeat protein
MAWHVYQLVERKPEIINNMKKNILPIIALFVFTFQSSHAQEKEKNARIDMLLIRGEYEKVIDTCRLLITTDSTDAEAWYEMGLAYQNLLYDDKSFECFSHASSLAPDNSMYNFMLAKGYLNKGKTARATPLLETLCNKDTLNWTYAFYLTSIYMQEGKYDESLRIYNRFYRKDTTNTVFIDKTGFAFLKKGEYSDAIDLYNKSLFLNQKNTNALRNLSYLYASTYRADTAIKLLTRAIEIDPDDMDLLVRRGGLFYLMNNKRALNDYLSLLSSADSSTLYLKRAGIGYSNNQQPKEAVNYLLKAYKKDSNDYETTSYLGRNFNKLNDTKNSIYFYKRTLKILTPALQQTEISNVMLAESQKKGGLYKDAIDSYINALKTSPDVNLYIIIANIYDEKLSDTKNAIHYYELFLEKLKTVKMNFKSEYVDSVRKRVQFLKDKQKGFTLKPQPAKPK